MRKVNTQNLWTFELGTQEGINVPIWVFVALQRRNRQDSQKLNIDTFYRPPVTTAQCINRTEKNPDSSILLNYNDEYYTQGYGQIKEAFRAFTRDNILQPYIYLRMILDPLMMVMILDTVYTSSIYDIRKT